MLAGEQRGSPLKPTDLALKGPDSVLKVPDSVLKGPHLILEVPDLILKGRAFRRAVRGANKTGALAPELTLFRRAVKDESPLRLTCISHQATVERRFSAALGARLFSSKPALAFDRLASVEADSQIKRCSEPGPEDPLYLLACKKSALKPLNPACCNGAAKATPLQNLTRAGLSVQAPEPGKEEVRA